MSPSLILHPWSLEGILFATSIHLSWKGLEAGLAGLIYLCLMQFFHPEKMRQLVGALRKSKTIEQIYQLLGMTWLVGQWAGC